jgi:CheY-like chemotaxis protein
MTQEIENEKRLHQRILVVDDNKDIVDCFKLLLKLDGHEVETAQDGLAALAAAEKFRPDAILLDIGMPGVDGYEVCRRIRKTPWGKNVVMIAQTGWGAERDRRLSGEAGFDEHLVKPVDFDVLMKLLNNLKK